MPSPQLTARNIGRLYRLIEALEGILNDVAGQIPADVVHRLDAGFQAIECEARHQLADALHDAGITTPAAASAGLLDFYLDRQSGDRVMQVEPPAAPDTQGGAS
jgi:hypothetical protein